MISDFTMPSIDDLMKAFESLELGIGEHKKLLVALSGKRQWTYTFPGIEGEPELTTKTDSISSMITDIRDWYDFVGLESWSFLEDRLKIASCGEMLISFSRNGTKTVFDFEPKEWMVKILCS